MVARAASEMIRCSGESRHVRVGEAGTSAPAGVRLSGPADVRAPVRRRTWSIAIPRDERRRMTAGIGPTYRAATVRRWPSQISAVGQVVQFLVLKVAGTHPGGNTTSLGMRTLQSPGRARSSESRITVPADGASTPRERVPASHAPLAPHACCIDSGASQGTTVRDRHGICSRLQDHAIRRGYFGDHLDRIHSEGAVRRSG